MSSRSAVSALLIAIGCFSTAEAQSKYKNSPWHADFQAASALAAKQGQPLLVTFR